jgi:hypothetical protein
MPTNRDYLKNKANGNRMFLYRKNKISKLEKEKEEIFLKEIKQQKDELFSDFMKELKFIKRKATVKRYLHNNKEIVEGLTEEQRNELIKYIRINY